MEKDLGVMVDKLNRSQQCALAAKKVYQMLGSVSKRVDSKLREVILVFC